MSKIVLETKCGMISGNEMDNGIQTFLGIRYATAGRWEYPLEVTSWEGIYDAGSFKAASYQRRAFHQEQPDSFYYNEFRKDEQYEYSEDCLFLNIWKPKKCKDAPVILYIHGGAFQGGCGNEKHFDGTEYAKRGNIFITCNYRLGALGYCCLPELIKRDGHTGNYGLYDQLIALQWVYNNISLFGGNPENITIMGQSAGAMSTQQLCVSPLAKKYIAKAIMTSGGGVSDVFGNMVTVEETFPFWQDVMSELGRTLEDWVKCDVQQLFDVTFEKMHHYENAITYCSPVVDKGIVPYETKELRCNKMQAEIPYLMGSTKDDLLPEEIQRMAKEWAVLQSKQGKIPSYCFKFARDLPGDQKGAWHSSELWYTIGALHNCWRPFVDWDYKISNMLIDYFCNFAKVGNPNGENLPTWMPTCKEEDAIFIISNTQMEMEK